MNKSLIHTDPSNFLFSYEQQESLLNAKFWTERQLLALCLGVVPKKYGDRDDCAPEDERGNAYKSISGGIDNGSGALYATKNPNADAGARSYGEVWNIEPIHAAKWITSEFQNFPKFPEWLLSELQSRYEKQVANRQTKGYFTLDEAVESIAEQEKMDDAVREKLLKNLLDDARNGLITVRDLDTGIAPISLQAVCRFREVVFRKDVDEWAAAKKAPWQWGAPPSPAPVVADEIAFDMVATRQELIDAFGKFTGMNLAWFDNLKDSPKLKAARKYNGQGGRHSAEPLFCPFEVMQWLADPKRKKGKPLNDATAWRLLKESFGKVYNQYSIGEPDAN